MRFTSRGMRCKQNNIMLVGVRRSDKQDGCVESGGSGSNIKLIKSVTILSRSEVCSERRYEVELR